MTDECDGQQTLEKALASKAREEAYGFYGSSKSWKRRADRFRFRLRLQSWIGLAVPLLTVGSYQLKGLLPTTWDPLQPTLIFVTILFIPQSLIALWSLVSKWDDELTYAEGSMKDNLTLFKRWDALARDAALGKTKNLQKRMDQLVEEAADLEAEDEKRVTRPDRRFAMRATLYKYQRPCVSCQKAPSSLDPSKCDTCGKFSKRNLY